jgi:hypothetical protein
MVLRQFWIKGKYWLLLAVILILALYPLSFFEHIPKWDSVRGYLPYRFFISDYLSDGHLPLWNPFQRLGYPGYSDLQSGCWYPVIWLLMLFGQYDITSLIIEVVLCFVIAAWGMFTLSNWMHRCNRTAVIIALSYALSGCMVGSAQLMVFLIGMAWLPWILWAWLRVLKADGLRYAALLAVFLMCNITGASPAFTIVLIYVLPAIGAWYFFTSDAKLDFLKRTAFQVFIAISILLLLLAPYIVAFIDFMPYFNRTGKLPYEDMIINPFVWSDYISFIFPYAVLSTHSMFAPTDLSLRNSYIGLVCLVFFVLAMTTKTIRNKWFPGLMIGLVLAFWLALGDYSGIYQFTYHLPGFGLFRHPAFFRGYGILCMLLLAGFAIPRWLNGEWHFPKRLLVALALVLGCVALGAWFSTDAELVKKTVQEIMRAGEFPSHGFAAQLFVNSLLALLLLALLLVMSRIRSLSRFALLMMVVVLDLMLQTRLSAPTTLYHSVDYDSTAAYFEEVSQLPAHDQRYNEAPMKTLNESDGLLTTPMLEKNVSTYNRQISIEGENPMRFRAFDRAKDDGTLAWVAENSLMYFPYRVCMDGDSMGPGCLFSVPVHLDNIGSECSLHNPQVDYNSYSAEVDNPTDDERWLVLNANYHHLWNASLNGAALPVERVNKVVMGIKIPAHTSGILKFTYRSAALPWAIVLAFAGLVVVALLVLGQRRVAN